MQDDTIIIVGGRDGDVGGTAEIVGSRLSLSYLIFVIFFTQARFLENKIYTEERVNYDKWILRQNSVNRDLLGQANYKDQDYTKFVTHCV